VDTCPQQQRITMATNPATDPFLARTLAAMENPPPMFRTCAAPATPTARTPPVPSIPCRSPTQPSGFNHTADAAPKCDHDTDTLASFLAWRSATHQIENVNQTVEALLSLLCQFVRAEMKHKLANQSTTVKIPGLQDIKNWEEETQKQILTLTNTINELTTKVAILSARPTPVAIAVAPRGTLAPPQQCPKPPTTKKIIPTSAPTYVQVAEKQPMEFTEVRSKKKARIEMILPKPYLMADRLIIFSLTTASNDHKEAADRALQAVNKAITTHADIEHPPRILANITASNNLIFTVAPQFLSTIYEPYLAILEEALHEFPITSSWVS